MLVKHYAKGKFYRIALPEGSRLVRRSGRLTHDVVIVPYEGREIAIAADPPETAPAAGRIRAVRARDRRRAGARCQVGGHRLPRLRRAGCELARTR